MYLITPPAKLLPTHYQTTQSSHLPESYRSPIAFRSTLLTQSTFDTAPRDCTAQSAHSSLASRLVTLASSSDFVPGISIKSSTCAAQTLLRELLPIPTQPTLPTNLATPCHHHTCCALHNNPPSHPNCATKRYLVFNKCTNNIIFRNERGCNHVVNDVAASAFYWIFIACLNFH